MMEDCSESKIWKYMDLAKFVSLLSTKSLYFACPFQFHDSAEGSLPKSHMEAWSKLLQQSSLDPMLSLRPHFAAQSSDSLQQFDGIIKNLATEMRLARRKATLKFGVSCWQKSEHESEAMWKLYSTSGQGIAIESTIGQLKTSLGDRAGLTIDSVRYADFEQDPIEKGQKHYGLFMKRNCFEHEKELRATILLPDSQSFLPEKDRGILVPCDLDVLINRVHVSPLSEKYVSDAVEDLCLGKAHILQKPVLQSQLFHDPGYDIKISTETMQPIGR